MSAFGYWQTFSRLVIYVRFTPESRHNRRVQSKSALPRKADYFPGGADVCFGSLPEIPAAILKANLNKAHREGLMDAPPRFPKSKVLKHRTRWLTLEEEKRRTQAAPRHLVPLIRFAVDTGGRLSELLSLDWRNVEMEERRIRFTDTKNGEDRTVRLCDRAHATLVAIGPKDSGTVFTYNGRRVKSMKTAFNKARERAGLEDVRFHDLRHTFASRLVQVGVPLYEVMHLTGHKSLEMVQRYSHLAPDYAERAIQALNAFGHDLVTPQGRDAA